MITERDLAVVDWLSEVHYARTSHVARVFFRGLRQANLVARRRLRRLLDAGMVRRFSDDRNGEYVWHVQAKARGRLYLHALLVAEIQAILSDHPAVMRLQYTPEYTLRYSTRQLQADAFALIGHVAPSGREATTLAFVEVDRQEDISSWAGHRKYEDYLISQAWREEWWFEAYRVFPRVVMVGQGKRLDMLRKKVREAKVKVEWLPVEELRRGNLGAFGIGG